MKKKIMVLGLIVFGVSIFVHAAPPDLNFNSSEPHQNSEVLLAEWFDDGITVIKSTTAYGWGGFAWVSCDARIGRKDDGSYWVEIDPPAGDPFVCPVEENPDYTGGYSGGRRTFMTHMTTCRSTTYYFDM